MAEEFKAVEWVDEPPPTGKSRYQQWLAGELKANPGKWAMMEGKAIQASAITKGTYSAFRPAGAYEATNRKPIGETTLRTFIRYVGLNPDPPRDNGAAPGVERTPARQQRVDQLVRERQG